MKFLGLICGVGIYADSEDNRNVELVEKVLKNAFSSLYRVKTDKELHDEVIKSLMRP